jgi:hypothetical protein
VGRVIPEEADVAQAIAAQFPTPSIPIRDIVPWAALAGVFAVTLVYFTGVEQGALSLLSNQYVHEFVHDARHLAGFPCH